MVNGILINALSLGNKFQQLDAYMTAKSVEIVGITETWLTPDDDDCRFLCKNTHNIFRKDRKNGIHGGVALLISKKYKSVEVTFDGVTELEYICARIISNRSTFYFATV